MDNKKWIGKNKQKRNGNENYYKNWNIEKSVTENDWATSFDKQCVYCRNLIVFCTMHISFDFHLYRIADGFLAWVQENPYQKKGNGMLVQWR